MHLSLTKGHDPTNFLLALLLGGRISEFCPWASKSSRWPWETLLKCNTINRLCILLQKSHLHVNPIIMAQPYHPSSQCRLLLRLKRFVLYKFRIFLSRAQFSGVIQHTKIQFPTDYLPIFNPGCVSITAKKPESRTDYMRSGMLQT